MQDVLGPGLAMPASVWLLAQPLHCWAVLCSPGSWQVTTLHTAGAVGKGCGRRNCSFCWKSRGRRGASILDVPSSGPCVCPLGRLLWPRKMEQMSWQRLRMFPAKAGEDFSPASAQPRTTSPARVFTGNAQAHTQASCGSWQPILACQDLRIYNSNFRLVLSLILHTPSTSHIAPGSTAPVTAPSGQLAGKATCVPRLVLLLPFWPWSSACLSEIMCFSNTEQSSPLPTSRTPSPQRGHPDLQAMSVFPPQLPQALQLPICGSACSSSLMLVWFCRHMACCAGLWAQLHALLGPGRWGVCHCSASGCLRLCCRLEQLSLHRRTAFC